MADFIAEWMEKEAARKTRRQHNKWQVYKWAAFGLAALFHVGYCIVTGEETFFVGLNVLVVGAILVSSSVFSQRRPRMQRALDLSAIPVFVLIILLQHYYTIWSYEVYWKTH